MPKYDLGVSLLGLLPVASDSWAYITISIAGLPLGWWDVLESKDQKAAARGYW